MKKSGQRRWAEFRFQVIGQLLAAPPEEHGELRRLLDALAARTWTHPTSGEPTKYAADTIERWYRKAVKVSSADLVDVLMRKRRSDACGPMLAPRLAESLAVLHRDHKSWTAKLLHKNLVATACAKDLGACPSYQTVRRYLRHHGMQKLARRRGGKRDGEERALVAKEQREVRSYEATHVGGLLHLDFHHARRQIVAPNGAWVTPTVLAIIDDRSRLICHMQWYLSETTEDLVHGFSQALMRRGLPRALMTDNGAAMMSAEFTEGLVRLGISHEPTLAYSPYQNGKIENYWGVVEGQLMAMLENKKDLTLSLLNRASAAWVDLDYNHEVHSETKQKPVDRFLAGPSEMRKCPDAARLRDAFRTEETRTQRRSDGTVTVGGVRFEVPDRLRHVERLLVRYARWDLGKVDVVDQHTGKVMAPLYPLDKAKNADARRRGRTPAGDGVQATVAPAGPVTDEIGPHLAALMQSYADTGLPPAFIPQN